MARVIGWVNAILRGKLAGQVYSRVAGRDIVRAYVKGVQPNTAAQLNARAAFGSASQSYHSLTDALKAGWSSYAHTVFNAKDGVNEGQWSGANAYVSLKNLVNMSAVSPLVSDYEDDSGVALNGVDVPFVATASRPTDQLAANIASGVVGAPANMVIGTVVLQADAKFAIDLSFGGILVGGLGQGATVDGNGNPFGFAVYVSEILNQEHNFVQNPESQLIGIMPGVDAGLADLTAAAGMKIQNVVPLNTSKFKTFGGAGDIVQLSLYNVSDAGMIACIGKKKVTITAA